MNKDLNEGVDLVRSVVNQLSAHRLAEHHQVICLPPFTHLWRLRTEIDSTPIKLGAQNVHHEEEGAYTGEVSAAMLSSLGVDHCLVGHSERRIYQRESDDELKMKLDQLIKYQLTPIYCLGESLEERESGEEFNVVRRQLALTFSLSNVDFTKLIIAYEPVWAIGTGKTASAEQAQEMHAFIRKEVEKQYGMEIAEATSILYGGSCKPDNAAELFSQEDVDGGLIGGASLDAESFVAIIKELN